MTETDQRSPSPDARFEALYTQHYTGLVRLASFLLNDPAAAEDVVQEAFARLAATSRRSRARDYSLAYVRRCVVNASRSSWRRRVVALRKWPLLTVGVARADDHDPALATFERLDLVRALRKLPRRQREVLVLRYYADLTEANVAELLDISVGAVKSYSARGLAGLRASLESLDEHT